METVLVRAPENTDFGLKSTERMRKSRKKIGFILFGASMRRYEPCIPTKRALINQLSKKYKHSLYFLIFKNLRKEHIIDEYKYTPFR